MWPPPMQEDNIHAYMSMICTSIYIYMWRETERERESERETDREKRERKRENDEERMIFSFKHTDGTHDPPQ